MTSPPPTRTMEDDALVPPKRTQISLLDLATLARNQAVSEGFDYETCEHVFAQTYTQEARRRQRQLAAGHRDHGASGPMSQRPTVIVCEWMPWRERYPAEQEPDEEIDDVAL